MASKIRDTQEQIERRIEEIINDSSVVVMSRLRGQIANNVQTAINRNKIVVLCIPPIIGGIKPNVVSRTLADDCRMQIRVVEQPKLNSANKNAYEVVEDILSINGFKTSDGVQVSVATVQPIDPEDLNFVEFVVELKMSLSFERVANP